MCHSNSPLPILLLLLLTCLLACLLLFWYVDECNGLHARIPNPSQNATNQERTNLAGSRWDDVRRLQLVRWWIFGVLCSVARDRHLGYSRFSTDCLCVYFGRHRKLTRYQNTSHQKSRREEMTSRLCFQIELCEKSFHRWNTANCRLFPPTRRVA